MTDRGRSEERGVAPLLVAVVVAAIVAALIAAIWVGAVRARNRRTAQAAEPTAEVALIAPLGGVDTAPRAFRWKPVPAADSYKVTIGDDDALWPIFVRSTNEAQLPLDEKDAGAIAAGRIHAWEVVALDAAGRPVARGKARFRVRLPNEAPGAEPLY